MRSLWRVQWRGGLGRSRWRWRCSTWSTKVSRFVSVCILVVRCHSLIGPRHVGIKALLFGSLVGVATLHTWRVGGVTRGLECSPCGFALFCPIGSGRLRCLAIIESSPDLLVRWKFRICSWWRYRPSWRGGLGLSLRTSLRIPRLLLLLLLPVLSIVHVLPRLECILTLGCGIRTFRCRCWTWEVCETIGSSCLRSLVCTWLCPSRWWRVRRSCLVRIASSAATAASAATACGIQASLASISIVSALLTRLAQNLMCSLDSLKFGYVFFFFASVSVGVVL